MSNVNLTIGGRPFTVACAAGEEKHVSELGHMIDAKLSTLEPLTGHNEVRMLLFAALLLADELHERRETRPAKTPTVTPALAKQLDTIAGQMENLALRLETEAGSA